MRLDRLGSTFPTRLSFMRILLRQMAAEDWRLRRTRFDIDGNGFGRAVYTVSSPQHTYSLIAFSQFLDPTERTDRVIAEAWDATFVLFDGVPTETDIDRLAKEAPLQEAGRYRTSDLVLSRANKSVRLFEHVVDSLASGRQPNRQLTVEIGYLMRTTAVYANGKFGLADRSVYADRVALSPPFQAEMLTVYLIRCFTFDLVEHVARCTNPDGFVPLNNTYKRYLGIGNATGLGMAPFLISHPTLIHNWFHARETALADIRSVPRATAADIAHFESLIAKAAAHVGEWNVEDETQTARIEVLRQEVEEITKWPVSPDTEYIWDGIFRRANTEFSMEGQELLVSILLELYPDNVDKLAHRLSSGPEPLLNAGMTVGELRRLLADHYMWTRHFDFGDDEVNRYVWYYSDEKLEPRRGVQRTEIGASKSMSVAIARDIQALRKKLAHEEVNLPLAAFLLEHPECRDTVRRVQNAEAHPYSELRENLIGTNCRPIDILRAKLAYFGASRFDPKSDLWTRITLYQGAPLPTELSEDRDWSFPVLEA